MQQSPSADNPQPSALAWLAGLADGEGCFGLNVQKRRDRERLQVTPRFSLVNTSSRTIEYVDWILADFRIGHLVKKRKRHNPRHRQQWVVEVIGYKRMEKFLPLVLPFLVTKRYQAELMYAFVKYRLECWQQPNGGRSAGYDGMELEVHEVLKALNHSEGSETIDAATRLTRSLEWVR